MISKLTKTIEPKKEQKTTVTIVRHNLPIVRGPFVLDAYGFKPLSLSVEGDEVALYEIAVVSEDDERSWPHYFVWVETWEELPGDLRQDSFIGTVQLPNGLTLHLFQEWKPGGE